MNQSVRRAGAFAAVGALALAAPLLGPTAIVPFLLVAAAALVITNGPVFELFARPTDREAGRLRALFDFALAATVLGGLSVFGDLPITVFAGSVLLVTVGNLGAEVVRVRASIAPAIGFLGAGSVGAAVGIAVVSVLAGEGLAAGSLLLLCLTGALVGALIRSMLFPRDEPPVLLTVGLVLWFLAAVDAGADPSAVAIAVAVMVVFGVLSYVLDTASLEGVLAGVLLGLVTIVLADYAWFALLLTFFGVGGLATKFRYETKLERGVAEENGGNRGGTNVLANSLVAVGAVCTLAAIEAGFLEAPTALVPFAFAGAVATALGDTLSSEIGGAFDGTRLITSLEPVPPGTDGAVTWQGTAAGAVGTATIGVLALLAFPDVTIVGAVAIGLGGAAGMTVDSVLGAAIEGTILGNSGVNFTATLAGALAAAGIAVAAGIVTVSGVAF
ncbi:DUF92 domain-containing protein [Salinarchaeum chitinilyticum]